MPTSGAIVFPDKAKLNFFSATGLLQANVANFRLAYVTSAYTPNNAADEVWADVSANEITAAGGYSAGGLTLAGVSLGLASGAVKFTANPSSLTASGGSIPAWRRGVYYYLGTLNSKVNPLVGHFLGDVTPADIPATASGVTLTTSPAAAGIVSVT